jgi:hypothetical protein
MAQDIVGPEFKPQNHHHHQKKKKKSLIFIEINLRLLGS